MNKNRLIQALACTLSGAAIVTAANWAPDLQRKRVEQGLVANVEVVENTPPAVALAATALGSFRGLAANVLWYRLEMLKRDGQFYEADTLSRMITTLQPRFPQVWVFMAWNMAYNISVESHTPDERWDWVNKGVRLMREEAIPTNPKAIRLYKELGWTLFHKVGGNTDDMHKYYKYRMAQEWDAVLGPMYEGQTTQQIIRAMVPMTQLNERYYLRNRLNYETRQLVRQTLQLNPDDAELKKIAYEIEQATVDKALLLLDNLQTQMQSRAVDLPQNFRIESYITQLREQLTQQQQAAKNQFTGDKAFFNDFKGQLLTEVATEDRAFFTSFAIDENVPDITPVLTHLEQAGIPFDRQGLIQVGRVISVLARILPNPQQQYFYWQLQGADKVAAMESIGLSRKDIAAFNAVVSLIFNQKQPTALAAGEDQLEQQTDSAPTPRAQTEIPAPSEELFRPFLRVVLPYWRTKALNLDYRMDPTTMQILMEEFGPLDWRHPCAHSAYWGLLGIQRSAEVIDEDRVDLVNTQRILIHSLQALYRTGTIRYNPYAPNANDRVSFQPNFAFVDAYIKAVFASREMYATLTDAREGTLTSFDAGLENFLSDVVVQAFIWGDEDAARKYYKKLRDEFNDKPDAQNAGAYTQALSEYVFSEVQDEILTRSDVANSVMNLQLHRAFREGFATGDNELIENLFTRAKQWYDAYQEDKQEGYKSTADTARLTLISPWPAFVQNAYLTFMTNPTESPAVRRSVLFASPPQLIRSVASQLQPAWSAEFPGEDWSWLARGTRDQVGEDEVNTGGLQKRK